MGLLDPHTYLDGSMTLDVERSRKAVQATVADPLGVTLDAALFRMEAAYLDRVAGALQTEPLTPRHGRRGVRRSRTDDGVRCG